MEEIGRMEIILKKMRFFPNFGDCFSTKNEDNFQIYEQIVILIEILFVTSVQ